MGQTLYCLALLACVGASLLYFVPRPDRSFALALLLCVLPIHIIVLAIVNQAVPFVHSEVDTFLYARYSDRVFTDITDAVNIVATSSAVSPYFGGVAYTHVLTIAHQFVGDSLFFKKALNIVSLWVIIFSWYAVALFLGGRTLARLVAFSCACLPTFWYFYCVILRDLLTAAIHSTLLAAAMLFALRNERRYVHVFVMIFALVASAFLRPATIYINLALLLIVFITTAREMGRGQSRFVVALILSALAIKLLLGSETLVSTFALEQKTSLDELGAQADNAALQSGASSNSPTAFLLRSARALPLFFASEPTIASSELKWGEPEQLRGLMNGAWFVIGTPFAVVGVSIGSWLAIKSLWARRSAKLTGSRFQGQLTNRGKTVTGSHAALVIVLLYCAVWFVVCVLAWDWTRWRLPAVPALCVIAIWGYRRISIDKRWIAMAAWVLAVSLWRMLG